MERTFYVFGSCVSRDGFEYSKNNSLIPNGYSARYSIARLMFPAVKSNYDLSLLSSEFQKKIVGRELENNLFIDIELHQPDFIILDFIDDRFGLVEIEHDVYVTNSFELRKSKVLMDGAKKISAQSDVFFELWCNGIDYFLDKIEKEGLLDKLIINAVFWSYTFENGEKINDYPDKTFDTTNYIEGFNYLLRKQYDYLKHKLSSDQFISYPKKLLTASVDHRWGKSPFHYNEDVYKFFLTRINNYSFSKFKNDGFFRWQKKAYLNINEEELFKLIPVNESALYSVNYDSNLVPLDLMFRGFKRENIRKYKKIIVSFNGAITNREKKNIPFFSLMDLSTEISSDCPFVSISDPSLYLSKNLSLAWYNGNSLFPNLIKIISKILDRLLDVYSNESYEIILCGGSGGGYAILNILNYVSLPDKFSALIWNPQISLSEYNLDIFKTYLNYAYPNLNPQVYERKSELKQLMINNNITEEVGKNISSQVIVLMNNDDHKHIFKHLSTFINKFDVKNSVIFGDNFISINNNIRVIFGNWGTGHAVPNREALKYFMEVLIKDNFSITGALNSKIISLPNEKILSKQELLSRPDYFWLNILSVYLSEDKLLISIDFPINKYYSVYNLVYYLVYKGKAIRSLWDTKITKLEFEINNYPVEDLRVRVYIRDIVGNQKIISKEITLY